MRWLFLALPLLSATVVFGCSKGSVSSTEKTTKTTATSSGAKPSGDTGTSPGPSKSGPAESSDAGTSVGATAAEKRGWSKEDLHTEHKETESSEKLMVIAGSGDTGNRGDHLVIINAFYKKGIFCVLSPRFKIPAKTINIGGVARERGKERLVICNGDENADNPEWFQCSFLDPTGKGAWIDDFPDPEYMKLRPQMTEIDLGLFMSSGSNGSGQVHSEVFYSGSWNVRPTVPDNLRDYCLTSYKNKVYLTGGQGAGLSNKIYELDAVNETGTKWKEILKMKQGRKSHSCGIMSKNTPSPKIVLVGGIGLEGTIKKMELISLPSGRKKRKGDDVGQEVFVDMVVKREDGKATELLLTDSSLLTVQDDSKIDRFLVVDGRKVLQYGATPNNDNKHWALFAEQDEFDNFNVMYAFKPILGLMEPSSLPTAKDCFDHESDDSDPFKFNTTMGSTMNNGDVEKSPQSDQSSTDNVTVVTTTGLDSSTTEEWKDEIRAFIGTGNKALLLDMNPQLETDDTSRCEKELPENFTHGVTKVVDNTIVICGTFGEKENKIGCFAWIERHWEPKGELSVNKIEDVHLMAVVVGNNFLLHDGSSLFLLDIDGGNLTKVWNYSDTYNSHLNYWGLSNEVLAYESEWKKQLEQFDFDKLKDGDHEKKLQELQELINTINQDCTGRCFPALDDIPLKGTKDLEPFMKEVYKRLKNYRKAFENNFPMSLLKMTDVVFKGSCMVALENSNRFLILGGQFEYGDKRKRVPLTFAMVMEVNPIELSIDFLGFAPMWMTPRSNITCETFQETDDEKVVTRVVIFGEYPIHIFTYDEKSVFRNATPKEKPSISKYFKYGFEAMKKTSSYKKSELVFGGIKGFLWPSSAKFEESEEYENKAIVAGLSRSDPSINMLYLYERIQTDKGLREKAVILQDQFRLNVKDEISLKKSMVLIVNTTATGYGCGRTRVDNETETTGTEPTETEAPETETSEAENITGIWHVNDTITIMETIKLD